MLKPESLVAILDVENVFLKGDETAVDLTERSSEIVDESMLVGEWWPLPESDEAIGSEVAHQGLFQGRKRGRKPKSAAKPVEKSSAGPADNKDDAKDDDKDAAKKKKKKEKKEKKKAKKAVKEKNTEKSKDGIPAPTKPQTLKAAAPQKKIPFEPQNFKRNGTGPVLMRQMMEKLKALEEQKFEIVSFGADGLCTLHQASHCLGVAWMDILTTAQIFFLDKLLGFAWPKKVWTKRVWEIWPWHAATKVQDRHFADVGKTRIWSVLTGLVSIPRGASS